MEKSHFTDQQRSAIETTGRDLLVAASAGTGKTTVLAQRCLYLRVAKNVHLRSVLAVTFTDAAAADMRRKIADGLCAHLEKHPDAALQREMLQIDRAPISTLHSFCFKLVREHFHELALDPGVTIIDAAEAELLKAEVADQLLERWFARDDVIGARFQALADAYGGRNGESLSHEMRRLHDFLQTLPDPEAWRVEVNTAYRAEGGFLSLHWFLPYRELWQRELQTYTQLAREAAALLDGSDGAEKYYRHLAGIQERLGDWSRRIEATLDDSGWTSFLKSMREFKWERAPTIPKATERQKLVQDLVRGLKDQSLKNLSRHLAAQSPDEMINGICRAAALLETLFALQSDFEGQYTSAKARRTQIDFNDLERYVYILRTQHPAPSAREIRRRFRHILVDEYQDINPLQDAILTNLSSDGSRKSSEMFFVGDEKQSIYGFRLAAPKLFLQKLGNYSADIGADEVRIPLTHNFRCRQEIIDAVNHVFERIASPALGNAYDQDARLVYGASYPDSPLISEPIPVECHLLEKDSSAEQVPDTITDDALNDSDADTDGAMVRSDLEREAALIARRISELLSAKARIWNSDRTESHVASFRDIVILLRTMRNRADTIAKVLRNHGIPVYTESTTGFFDAVEIRDMLALLELLDNAQQDVAMAAVLRSPIVGISDDDLAEIRVHHPSGRFHSAVTYYTEHGPNDRIRERLVGFRTRLEQWRVDATQLPLARVIWDIYRTTCYLEYVQGLPGGEGRRANLVRLHDRARQFDQFQQRGLFRFLRFLHRLQEADQDLGSEPVLSEADDVVRIMSIHKSKGLEFPMVFLPDLAKPFNFRDTFEPLLFHQDLLLGIDIVDLDRMQRAPTLPKMVIADEKRKEVLAEEQRLLYVALTRARERLILSGTAKVERAAQRWTIANAAFDGNRLAARCILDWLGPVLVNHPDTAPALGTQPAAQRTDTSRFRLSVHSADTIRSWEKPAIDPGLIGGGTVDAMLANHEVKVPKQLESDPAVADAKSRLEWRYPFAHAQHVPGKLSVTEWKRRQAMIGDEDQPSRFQPHPQITRRPRFIADVAHRVTAAERGSATHAVLQRLDLSRPCDGKDIEFQIDQLVARRLLGNDVARAVHVDTIVAFLNRPLGLRLRRAPRLQRELPFSALLPALAIPPNGGSSTVAMDATEMVLVQGVIDCLFWEDGSPILIDYKTDDVSVDGTESAAENYRVQISLYERALRAIHGFDVCESHIVFLNARCDSRM